LPGGLSPLRLAVSRRRRRGDASTALANKPSRPALRPGAVLFRVTSEEVGEICEEDRAAWGPVDAVALGARPATKVCTPAFCLVGAELAPVLVVVWRVEQARLPAVIFVAVGELCSMVVGAWGVSPTDVSSVLPSSRPRASVYCGSSQSHVAMELLPTSGLWPWLPVVVGGGWWLLPDASRRGGSMCNFLFC